MGFLFVSERPSIFSLIGGATILLAVLIQFYTLLKKVKKLFLIDISIYLLDYVFTGETTEYRSAEGATTQESLRQKGP